MAGGTAQRYKAGVPPGSAVVFLQLQGQWFVEMGWRGGTSLGTGTWGCRHWCGAGLAGATVCVLSVLMTGGDSRLE